MIVRNRNRFRSPPRNPSASVVVSPTGVLFAGQSYRQTSDGVGGKERKAIVVSFDAAGPSGAGVGQAEPHFFSYRGHESFQDAALVGGKLYAVGSGEESGFD